MKNRGFTLIELITTFVLASVIIILLIQVVVVIKNMYYKSDLKTELYINQANLSNTMNKKLGLNNLSSYTTCISGDMCYQFTLSNGEEISLIIDDNTIKFGTYAYKLDKASYIDNPSLTNDPSGFLIISIPIKNDLYRNLDFGINLVYPYDPNQIVL